MRRMSVGGLVVDAGRRVLPVWRSLVVATWILVVPANSFFEFNSYDEQRLLQVVMIAVLIISVFPTRLASLAGLLRSLGRWRWAVATMVALGLVSTLLSADPFTALLDVGLVVGMAIVAITVATDVTQRPVIAGWLLGGLLVASLAYYTADLLTFPGVLDDPDMLWQRGGQGGFENVRHYNQYVVAVLPFTGGVAVHDRLPPWIRLLGLMLGVLGAWQLWITTARGALVAIVAAAAAIGLTHRGPGRTVAAAVATTVVAGAGVASLTHWLRIDVVDRFGGAEGIVGSSGRVDIWSAALERVVNNPILGIGPGHLGHASRLADNPLPPGIVVNHPHNIVVRFAAEWGIPVGLFVALAGLATAWVIIVRWRGGLPGPEETASVAASASLAVLTVLTLSLVSGVFITPVASTVAASVIGVLLGLRAVGERDVALGRPSAWGTALAAGLAGALVLAPLIEVLTNSEEDRREDARAFVAGSGATVIGPRFWTQGLREHGWEPPPGPVPLPVGGNGMES